MRIAFFTIGAKEPATRFRVEQYIPLLEDAGWRCTVWNTIPTHRSRLFIANFKGGRYLNAKLLELIAMSVALPRVLASGKFDVVFLQRRLPDVVWFPWLEHLLRQTSRRLIFDFDDAIYMNHSSAKGFHSNQRSERSFNKIVQFSDQIIAGNTYLENMTNLPFKTTVIPTALDTNRFRINSKKVSSTQGTLTIGWTGTSSNYIFLYPLAATIKRVIKRFPHTTLKIICDRPPDLKLLPGIKVKFVKWQANNEVEQLKDIDVGIMYLPDTPWARGKCGFKLLQYMALSKPVVASPIGANLDIVNHGVNGYLATTMVDWYEYLSILMEETKLRVTLGEEARRSIEAHFSVRSCFPKLLSVLQRALDEH